MCIVYFALIKHTHFLFHVVKNLKKKSNFKPKNIHNKNFILSIIKKVSQL